MGRREAPVPAGPLREFALRLRELRVNAPGAPTYRELADRAHYSASVLSVAASGRRLPTWDVTGAFVAACGGDVDEWRERWTSLHAELQAAHPDLLSDLDAPPESAVSPAAASETAGGAWAQRSADGVSARAATRRTTSVRLGLGAAAAVALAAAGIVVAVNLVNSSESNGQSGTDPARALGASPKAWTATSGPSCSTGSAVAMDTSGSWTPLAGSATGGCGDALIHRTTDSGDGANWVFYPGVGRTCAFRIDIPHSNAVTASNVIYQAWDTLPGKHTDGHRIGGNVRADQQANRGRAITITFGPTKNGTIDLQIYDDYPEHKIEAADTVTATCH